MLKRRAYSAAARNLVGDRPRIWAISRISLALFNLMEENAMKKIFGYILAASAVFAAASCTQQLEGPATDQI